LLDAQLAWRMIQKLTETQLDAVIAEKQQAVELIVKHRAALVQAIGDRGDALLEPLVGSLTYAESLFETLRYLVVWLIANRRWQHGRSAAAEEARARLLAAQSHWNQHTQRHGSLPGAATPFREVHFWDLTENI